MQSSKYPNKNSRRQASSSSDGRLLYDARGVRVKKKKAPDGIAGTLLYWVLPFIVINLLIFTLVTSAPKIDINVADTNDYRSTTVTFTVKSLLPVKNVQALWEYAEPLELSKDGKTYTAAINQNGNISVEATSFNGMTTRIYENIDILDGTPPQINPDDCEVGNDKLTIKITDSQSGVNFDTIYAVDPAGRQVTPTLIDKGSGTVEFPMYLDALEVYAEDMTGNPVQANFSTTNAYKLQKEQEEAAEGETSEAEENAEETEESSSEQSENEE